EANSIPKFKNNLSSLSHQTKINEGEQMRMLGENAMKSSLQAKALAYFNRAVELNPDDAMAIYDRAQAEAWFDKTSQAMADYNRAIKLKPAFAKAYVGRAFLLENLKNYKNAIANFDKAIVLDPHDCLCM